MLHMAKAHKIYEPEFRKMIVRLGLAEAEKKIDFLIPHGHLEKAATFFAKKIV